MLSIGQVAQRAGTTASAIRFYERRGLMPKPVRHGGKRRYDEEAVARLRVIKLAQSASFTLDEIGVLLRATENRGRAAKTMQRLAKDKLPRLKEDRARIDALIEVMTAAARCRCPSLERCVSLMAERGIESSAGGGTCDRNRL